MTASGGPVLPGAPSISAAQRSLSVRTVLVFGFLLTAGTWLFAGYYFDSRMRAVQGEAAEVSRRYMQAQALLSDTRAELYRASIFVRDALLDPEPEPGRYRSDVETAYREADELLAQYEPVLGSRLESERTERLRRDIADLRDANLGVLSTDSRTWRRDASELLVGRIMPKREAALLVAAELQTLNRNAYVKQQMDTITLYRDIQDRFWRTFGMAVLATLCIAWFSVVHLTRLERRLRQEQEKDARTAAELQRLSAKLVSAQEEERRTIARELHDEIGQILTVVKFELSHAQRYIGSLGGKPDFLDDARSITDRALDAVRDISHFLHPSVLDDLGLELALRTECDRIAARSGIDVQFRSDLGERRLPPDVALCLFRIAQESIRNAVRHAEAKRIDVEVSRDAHGATLQVVDNGNGYDPSKRRERASLGVASMRERVALLRGRLRIRSRPGQGTRVTAWIPLRGTE